MRQQTLPSRRHSVILDTLVRLVEPVDRGQDALALRRARLTLAYMVTVFVVLAVLTGLHALLANLGMNWPQVMRWLTMIPHTLAVLASMVVYVGMARAGYDRAAALLYCVAVPPVTFLFMVHMNHEHAALLVYFFVGSLVLSVLVHSLRAGFVNYLYGIVWMLAVPQFAPGISYPQLIDPLIINGFVLAIVSAVIAVSQREYGYALARIPHVESERDALLDHFDGLVMRMDERGVINAVFGRALHDMPHLRALVGDHALSHVQTPHIEKVANDFDALDQTHTSDLGVIEVRDDDGALWQAQVRLKAMREQGRFVGAYGFLRPLMPEVVKAAAASAHAEAQLEYARQRVERLIAQMPVAVIEWDTERVIHRWNPAAEAIFGYSAEEALGQEALHLLVPEHQREHVADIFAQIVEGDEPAYSVNENLTRSGRLITCEWVNTPLFDDAGHKIGLASLAQDVTERIHAEERAADLLVAQDRLQTMRALVDVIAHFFRNHMANIEVNRHLIKRLMTQGKHEEATQRLETLQRGMDQIGEQLENLAAVAAAARPVVARCDLVALAGQAVRQRTDAARARSVEVKFAPPTRRMDIVADAQRVRDALKQLIASAIGRTPPGGTVEVAVMVSGATARLTVRDNGPKISTQEMQRAFDIFNEPDAVRATETNGDVLALGIARLVAETHGGCLQVERKEGEGNVVTMVLPVGTAN